MNAPLQSALQRGLPAGSLPELDTGLPFTNRFAGLGETFFTRLQPQPLGQPARWVGFSVKVRYPFLGRPWPPCIRATSSASGPASWVMAAR
jgi:hypothetical protein